jgi:hypothetical protein
MMAMAEREVSGAEMLEKVLIGGDLSKLTSAERLQYYDRVCKSLGLNPLTKPFDYITLNSKLTLYAKRDCTDQLRKINSVSIDIVERQTIAEVYIVTVKGTNKEGRYDTSTGAVNIANLKGESLANALMKAETKGKRRVTLSLCGLGWIDETEIETVPDAHVVQVNHETGEVQQPRLQNNPTPKANNAPGPVAHGSKLNWSAFWARTREIGFDKARINLQASITFGLKDVPDSLVDNKNPENSIVKTQAQLDQLAKAVEDAYQIERFNQEVGQPLPDERVPGED